jgi:hypothetical protein
MTSTPFEDHSSHPMPGNDRFARLTRLYAFVSLPLCLISTTIMLWPAANGLRDRSGATFGHDLSQIWVAGATALSGEPAAVYDIARHHAHLIEMFGPNAALFSWHYPPVFLLVAALLALVPYAYAVALWGAASLVVFASALRKILPDWPSVVVALACPLVLTSWTYGQNGLLSATLLSLGLVLAGSRPFLAGLALGATCYKPQLAFLIPFLMVLTGQWRVVAGAIVAGAALTALSALLFGLSPWMAFLQGLFDTNVVIFQDAWGGLDLNTSAFGAVRLLNGPIPLAWGCQICVSMLALAATTYLWTTRQSRDLCHAAALAAIPLMSPYVPEYDLVLLVPAAAFVFRTLAKEPLLTYERVMLVVAFGLTIDLRAATHLTHVPIGLCLSAGLFTLIVLRARRIAFISSVDTAIRSKLA